MIEVFKTNVTSFEQANLLMAQINRISPHYIVNFDLEDCDHILRIESTAASIEQDKVINLLKTFGFNAEVLPDNVPVDNLRYLIFEAG